MNNYQPFAVSNFRTGFNESVEPWLLPEDGYQSVVNARLYRGVLEKVAGYLPMARMTKRIELFLASVTTTKFTVTLPFFPADYQMIGLATIVAGVSAETFTFTSEALVGGQEILTFTGTNGGNGTLNLSTLLLTLNPNTPIDTTNPYSFVMFTYDAVDTTNSAIMGIKQYYDQSGVQTVMVFNQKRVGILKNLTGYLAGLYGLNYSIQEIPHEYYQSAIFTGDGTTILFTGNIAANSFVPGSVVITGYLNRVSQTVIIDNGEGALTGATVSSGFINYASGLYAIEFSVAPALGVVFNVSVLLYGNIFTGGISNFFSLVNYMALAFFCNNVDPIFFYNGTGIYYLNTNLSVKNITATAGVPAYDISKCLHLELQRTRLLLIAPTVEGINEFNFVYWSAPGQPLNFTNDEFLFATTSEPIRAPGNINTDLVLRFANSERIFRYTGDENGPFRFDPTNNQWPCDAPYSTINYDTWFSTVSRPAIVGSDGVNATRADKVIPDFTDPTRLSQQVPVAFMNQTSIIQGYGIRYDDLKEGWLCYNSAPVDQTQVTASDNVLAFNYLDETYAIYNFPFSCLGYGRVSNSPTWSSIFTRWEDMNLTWDSYQSQMNALIGIGGDQYNTIYQLDEGNVQTNVAGETTPVLFSVISKNFNPFIDSGQLARLGYIDIFVSAYFTTTLRVQFYINDELYIDSTGTPQGWYQETKLQFVPRDSMSPTQDQTKVWKRIYVGAVGKTHTVRFYQNILDFEDTDNQPIYIHAMVLYFKPAGRIFN